MASLGLSGWSVIEGHFMTSDFDEICGGIAWLQDDFNGPWIRKRSRLAGLLPALLSNPLGIIGGLASAAAISMAILSMSIVLWGQAIGGRNAGLWVGFACLGLPPLTQVSRTLSLYPEISAMFAATGAAIAWTLVTQQRTWLVIAAVLNGLVFCMDLKGVAWGVPFLLIMAGIVVHWRWRMGFVVIATTLAMGWLVGQWSYTSDTLSLETQMQQAAHPTSGLDAKPITHPSDGYVWGHSNPLLIPKTMFDLSLNATTGKWTYLPDDKAHHLHPAPILIWSIGALFGAIMLGIRRKTTLIRPMALVPALPFAAAWTSAVRSGHLESHTLSLSICLVALLWGLGIHSATFSRHASANRMPWRALTAAALLCLMAIAIPHQSVLSRQPHIQRLMDAASQDHPPQGPLQQACLGQLRIDQNEHQFLTSAFVARTPPPTQQSPH